MNTYRPLLAIMLALLFVFSDCKKDEKLPAVENEDVSDLIANSLETDAYGIASQFEAAVLLAESYTAPEWCGYSGDSTIQNHYDGVAVQYVYTFDWTYDIICSGTSTSAVNINNHCSGNCATSVLSSSFNSYVDWTIIGFAPADAVYVFNGTYIRKGDFTSKLRDQHSFKTDLTISLSDVRFGKVSGIANSGTATISAICTTDANEEFTFSGSLVFNGNQNCTLTLEGKTYTIQL